MIRKVGLLPADNWEQVPFAHKMYTRTDKVGWDQSTAFKQAFSNDVQIEFLGVWYIPATSFLCEMLTKLSGTRWIQWG